MKSDEEYNREAEAEVEEILGNKPKPKPLDLTSWFIAPTKFRDWWRDAVTKEWVHISGVRVREFELTLAPSIEQALNEALDRSR